MKDGGPAFSFVVPDDRDPTTGHGIRQGVNHPGMSLRDWFAGTIALTNFDERLIELYRTDGPKTVDETIEYIARLRGRHADAMLAERAKATASEKPD